MEPLVLVLALLCPEIRELKNRACMSHETPVIHEQVITPFRGVKVGWDRRKHFRYRYGLSAECYRGDCAPMAVIEFKSP